MEDKDLSNSITPRHSSASYSVAASYFGTTRAVLDDEEPAALVFGVCAVPAAGLAAGAGAGAGAAAENGLFGAIALIGGNALPVLAAGLAAGAGAGAGVAVNGFFGAAALIGGNPAAAGFLGAAAGV